VPMTQFLLEFLIFCLSTKGSIRDLKQVRLEPNNASSKFQACVLPTNSSPRTAILPTHCVKNI
jgi:hypothetical protein